MHEKVPITRIAREQFIAALAREDDFDAVLSSDPGDEVQGDRRRVGDRIGKLGHHLGQEAQEVCGCQRILVMARGEPRRDQTRVGKLVIPVLAEADAEGMNILAGQAPHAGHDEARVEAAAQKRTDGYVAQHMGLDRALDSLSERGDGFGLVLWDVFRCLLQMPEGALGGRPRLIAHHEMAWLQLFHLAQERQRSRGGT